MKTLQESILDIDDLEQNVKEAPLRDLVRRGQIFKRAPSESYELKMTGRSLIVTIDDPYYTPYGINVEELQKAGINKLKFNLKDGRNLDLQGCRINPPLKKISCNCEICNIGIYASYSRGVTFEAPIISCLIHESRTINNVSVKTKLLIIDTNTCTDGMYMLNKLKFGKYLTSKFKPSESDDYDGQAITNTVTLDDIIPGFSTINTNYIIIRPIKRKRTNGCYVVINPDRKSEFQKMQLSEHPIETLKDGWLITQYFGPMNTLENKLK